MSWRLPLLILLAVIFSAMGLVTSQNNARIAFAANERAGERTRQLNTEWDRLQLRQSELAAHAVIEQVAVGKLKMQLPSVGRTLIIGATAQ